MEVLSHLIKETIPNYLRALPVPNSFTGMFRLSPGEWLQLTPLITLISLPTYYLVRTYRLSQDEEKKNNPSSKVNLNIKKESSKVVDTCDIEEVGACDGKKKVFCRCWRSKAFPLCDGSHNAHNEATGDNVGPLIVKA